MAEWLDFHIGMGIEHFWIYDNGSTDGLADVLCPYLIRGIVELINYPGSARQISAYWDAMKRSRGKTEWIALIDADEFLVPPPGERITDTLRRMPPGTGQVLCRWLNYGSSGHDCRPKGPVVSAYLCRAPDSDQTNCKSISRPDRVVVPEVHRQYVAWKTVDASGRVLPRVFQSNKISRQMPTDALVCNHYSCKSRQDFEERWSKGDVRKGDQIRTAPDWNVFASRDKNDVFDDRARRAWSEWVSKSAGFQKK